MVIWFGKWRPCISPGVQNIGYNEEANLDRVGICTDRDRAMGWGTGR